MPYKWPVVPTFQDWKFPNRMPEVWTRWRGSSRPQILLGTASQSSYTTLVRARDFSCRITQHCTGTEVAHLCPESERDWFIANNMQQYKTNLNSAHLLKDPGNMLLIRSDLHKSFDDRSFVFFPKGPQGSLVLHTLQQIDDLSQIFHNVQLHPIHCCPEFLLTRFAWSIFPFLTGFLCRHVPRYVVTVDEEIGERAAKEVFDAKHLQDRAVRSRSKSLKKRERALEPGNDELADNDGLASCDASTSSQSKHSTDENQSLKRQKRNSHNSSSSLEVPTSPPHLTKNGFEWYPGSTRFDMLREQALSLQRPSNFHEQRKTKMGLREELEDMGFEILDDFDQNNEDTDNENGAI